VRRSRTALRSASNASGASAETKSLPSCPGFTSEATIPVSSYASPPTTAPAHAIRSARSSAYIVQPASTRCAANPRFIAVSTGRIQRSHAVG
jgi:hypothetical protein